MYVESLHRFKDMSLYPISPEAMKTDKRMSWMSHRRLLGPMVLVMAP